MSPFYFFNSGTPQIADFILVIGLSIYFIKNKLKIKNIGKIKKILLSLLMLIIIINIIQYTIVKQNYNITIRNLFPVLFYTYNVLVFILITSILRVNVKKNSNLLAIGIYLSIMLQFIAALAGFGKPAGTREVLFFNNPNQLGYFALLMVSIFTVLPSKYKNKNTFTYSLLLMSMYLVLLSGSRSTLVGIFILAILIIYRDGIKIDAKKMMAVSLFMISIIGTYSYTQQYLFKIKERDDYKRGNTLYHELQIRGYDKILLYPEYTLFGAGEILPSRFKLSYYQLEIHSAYGTMLFSYGILGLYLFILLIYKVIGRNMYYFAALLPVLLYNVTHQGLRFTQFWILLAVVYVIKSEVKRL